MAERSNISLDKGIRRSPTLGEEGQLSECINMTPRGGELVALQPPVKQYDYLSANDGQLLYIHSNEGYTHYMHLMRPSAGSPYTLYWSNAINKGMTGIYPSTQDVGMGTTTFVIQDKGKLMQILHIGNTIVILTAGDSYASDGMHYLLWDGTTYKNLGSSIPELPISFGLILSGSMLSEALGDDATEEQIAQGATAIRNKVVATAYENNYFAMPFLLKYCLRLFDGTTVHHSSPILFVPNSDEPLTVLTPALDNKVSAFISRAQIDYFIKDGSAALSSLVSDWSDIVKEMQIYVSAPFYPYEQSDDCSYDGPLFQTYLDTSRASGKCFGKFIKNQTGWTDLGYEPLYQAECAYLNASTSSPIDSYWGQGSKVYKTKNKLGARSKTYAAIKEEIVSNVNYYLLKSYNISELVSGTRTVLNHTDITPGRLKNIVAYTTLGTNDNHNILRPTLAFAYNNRLSIAQVEEKIVNPLPLYAMVPFSSKGGRVLQIYYSIMSASIVMSQTTAPTGTSLYRQQTIYKDGKSIAINDSDANPEGLHLDGAFHYLASTSGKATQINVAVGAGASSRNSYILQASDVADEAYIGGDISAPFTLGTSGTWIVESSDSKVVRNGIYTSEVSNPWIFPLTNKSTVGSGKVLAIAAATKPVSLGQFGTYPLIAFAEDGVWSLAVNADGTYSAPQPKSRDVLSVVSSVATTDNEVLFVTAKGLMATNGETVRLISGALDGANVDESHFFSSLSGTLSRWLNILATDTLDIRRQLQNSRISIDYAGRLAHIFIASTNNTKHYALSLASGEFTSEVIYNGTAQMTAPDRIVTDYPKQYLQFGNNIYMYEEFTGSEAVRPGLLLTRELSFGDAYAVKTIVDARVYATISNPSDTTASGAGAWMGIFASNDRVSWNNLSSLRGRPFKYYRIAVFSALGPQDALSGLTFEYEARRARKLR